MITFRKNLKIFKAEFDTDAVAKVRTKTGEWKTVDKIGKYGEAKEIGGIHGDDKAIGAAEEPQHDIYKRFRFGEKFIFVYNSK